MQDHMIDGARAQSVEMPRGFGAVGRPGREPRENLGGAMRSLGLLRSLTRESALSDAFGRVATADFV